MKKERVLEVYKIDAQAYQSICSVIGLKPVPELSGAQLNQFDEVRAWMESGECKNYKEAKERFAAIAQPSDPDEMSPTIDAIIRNRAEAELNGALSELDTAAQVFKGRFSQAFHRHIDALIQSAEFQVRAQQASVVELPSIDIEVAALPEAQPDAG